MGSITSGVGLVSGINTAQLIGQLLAIEGRGKITLQQRVASLSAQRTALLDVNSRLLNLKSAAAKFRLDKTFKSTLAKSGDETTLTGSADTSTAPGSYQFFVKRLASTNQLRSTAFATSNASPLGLDSLRFEFGDIGVQRSVDLSSLNGGDGVRRGKIVLTDKAGANATIDLSDATTLEEVVERINANDATGVSVSVKGERLVVTDTSVGGGQLKVADATGGFTATDLGIAGTTSGSTITSLQIHRLGTQTNLASLNDGNGVLIRDGITDFQLQLTNASKTYNISLGRKDAPITNSTKLVDLNNGSGIAINTTDAPDFKVRTSDGQTVDINLGAILDGNGAVTDTAVTTVGELINRVNSTLTTALGADKVVLKLSSDGKGFLLEDKILGSDPLRVLAAGPASDKTAKNLGIFTGPTGGSGPLITGLPVPNKVDIPRAATIQDVIDQIFEQTEGKVTASINSAGTGLQFSAGTDTVTVLNGTIDGSSFGAAIGERTARDLGIFGLSGSTVIGTRVLAGANTLLTSTINGGKGLDHQSEITIADRAGNTVTVGNLDAYLTLEDLATAINTAASTAGVLASISLSANNASLTVTDTSTGPFSLTISGGAASKLGIEGTGGATGVLKGKNLQAKHIGFASSLSSLNFGKGLGNGVFKLTDSTGATASVDIDASSSTLYDVIQEINSRGLKIEARINDNGDGISLVDTNTGTPTVLMKVQDTTGGIASVLGIKKSASALGGSIEGSFEKVVDLDASDSLTSVVSKLNAAGIPLSASLVNTGAGGTPFYLSIASSIGGKAGRLLIDTGGVDIGLTTISQGRDAELLFGNSDPASALVLRSSSNVFADVVGGLDVTAVKTSTSAITIDVVRDTEGIKQSIKDLVTAFNDAIGRIGNYDSYDVDTKKKGPLLGNPTLARGRQLLYTTIQGRAKNVSGQFQFLAQVGIRVGKKGELQLDDAKFDTAYASDPNAVEKLFVTFEQETVSAAAVVPGVTIGSTSIVSTALGFGDLLDQAMKSLTSTIDGAFSKADENFQSLIERTNTRISDFDKRLAARRAVLERQFNAMEAAISKLQTQQSSLNSIFSSFR
ncbi:MAG: flagellar filament capping protein FliD [Phycisphaerae bacterium]|nr:flagellar filament capping protein FliD [Phycisphaerae bacterium]